MNLKVESLLNFPTSCPTEAIGRTFHSLAFIQNIYPIISQLNIPYRITIVLHISITYDNGISATKLME